VPETAPAAEVAPAVRRRRGTLNSGRILKEIRTMPRGGRRPNAGRKLAPETIAFRDFWRDWFQSEEGRRHLMQRAKQSDAILGKILDKVFPSPQAVDISAENVRPIRITIGQPGHELNLGYKPMAILPGVEVGRPRRANDN
jgi:hypothetical protein